MMEKVKNLFKVLAHKHLLVGHEEYEPHFAYLNDEKNMLLPALIQGFKKMNLSITAEGIETEEMADIMRDISCDYLQGYYFSRPLPMDEFVRMSA